MSSLSACFMSVGIGAPSSSNFHVPTVVWSMMGSSNITAVLLGSWSRWKLLLSRSLAILVGFVSCSNRFRRRDLPVFMGPFRMNVFTLVMVECISKK